LLSGQVDDRKQNKPGWWVDRLDGKSDRVLWEEAIKANADWVLIGTWNEWPEGTEIEPSLEFGDKYLKITGEYSTKFLRAPPVTIPALVAPPRFTPGTTNRVERLFAGRKIGVLPGSEFEPRFWLAYRGAEVQQLSWADVIDSRQFNFPFVLHAGTDHFTTTVKVTDDVTRALIQYHGRGGFLVITPTAPWPFLYDDSKGGQPAAISDTLATCVAGWVETHPASALMSTPKRTSYSVCKRRCLFREQSATFALRLQRDHEFPPTTFTCHSCNSKTTRGRCRAMPLCISNTGISHYRRAKPFTLGCAHQRCSAHRISCSHCINSFRLG
jgi:hypothetical protein